VFLCASVVAKNHVQTAAYVSLARNASFALSCHQNSCPKSSRKSPEIHLVLDSKNFWLNVLGRSRTSTHSAHCHFFITDFKPNSSARIWFRSASDGEFDVHWEHWRNTETIQLGSGPACERWMSQTSHLAHHPFGAAVARSPHPASGGGGEGWPIPLVGQSERGGGLVAAVDRVHMELAATYEAVGQASGRMRTHTTECGVARSGS